jgi:hypothetical protein
MPQIMPPYKGIVFTASIPSNGGLSLIRWYTGIFKYTSLGIVRAVYRTVKIITKNRNLT